MASVNYTRGTLMRELGLVAFATLWAVPFYFLIATSVRPASEAYRSSLAPSTSPTVAPFRAAWNGTSLGNYPSALMGSVIVTGVSVLCVILLGSLTAYALSQFGTRAALLIYTLCIIGMILPVQLGLIPLYSALKPLHMVGNFSGLIVLYVGQLLPLSVFLYTGFMRILPADYTEAAQVDGAGPLRIYRRVVFPLLRPVTGTVAILGGLLVWNDFFTPLVFLSGSGNATLPLYVFSFVSNEAQQWNLIFAAVLLSIAPLLLFYFFAQKRLIRGFSGGIKS